MDGVAVGVADGVRVGSTVGVGVFSSSVRVSADSAQ